MISRKNIIENINHLEQVYSDCIDILLSVKNSPNEFSVQKFLNFQPMLCRELLKIERLRIKTSKELKAIRKKINSVRTDYLIKRESLLSKYIENIDESILMGKLLGDSFALIFYHKNKDMINQHLESPPIKHMPTGIGGDGEVEFISNLKGFKDHIVIYHGITTFLRMGDISLINLKTLNLTAIGELKTHSIDGKKLCVKLHLIGDKNLEQLVPFTAGKTPAYLDGKKRNPPKEIQARLERQIQTISSSFKSLLQDKNKMNASVKLDRYIKDLNTLIQDNPSKKTLVRQYGDGLLVTIIRNKKSKLSAKLFSKDITKSITDKGKDIIDGTIDILDKNTPKENSIYISSISDKHSYIRGMIPFILWKLPDVFIKDVFFHNSHFVSIYNPLFFKRKLAKIGVDLKIAGNGFEMICEMQDKRLKLEIKHCDYFLTMIQKFLVHENAVLDMINTLITKTKKLKKYPARIDINIYDKLQL